MIQSGTRIIHSLTLAAKDRLYDYVFLAVRFGVGSRQHTELIIANLDPEAIQVAKLQQLVADGGEPMGYIHVRLRRDKEEPLDALQISMNFDLLFVLYNVTPLRYSERIIEERKYLSNLSPECAIALHGAGLIRLELPE